MTTLTRPIEVAYPLEGNLTFSMAGRSYSQVVDRILERKALTGQILVTSANADEGKTLTAINLALALQARRYTVLLVEMSLIRPKLAEIFGDPRLPYGIEDVLSGSTDLKSVISERGSDRLPMAMVRQAQKTEEALETGPALDRLLADARREYRWTIVDGPPIHASEAGAVLVASIEVALLVARAQQTNRRSFQAAYERISSRRPMVLLNDEHVR